jgi:hypothetical protein
MTPAPTTRVERLAAPPNTLRAYPVVKSLTADAGISEWSGFMLHSMLPDWSAIAMPHAPGALREADAYHSETLELSHRLSPCAFAIETGANSRSASARFVQRELV